MNNKERIVDKLKKIAALAVGGVGGERENAKRILTKFLSKYNLTVEDLTIESKQEDKPYFFSYKDKMEKELLFQCCFYVTQRYDILYSSCRGKRIVLWLTPLEYIEMENLWKYYQKLWRCELKALQYAFICKYGFTGPETNNKERKSKLSQEELSQIIKLMNSLSDSDYVSTRKMLGGK